MIRIAKNYTEKIFSKFGFTVSRLDKSGKVTDLSDITSNPIEAYYCSGGKPFVMNIPIEKCHAIEFSGANKDNPYLQTLLMYSKGLCTTYNTSPLHDFYDSWQPGTTKQFYKDGKELAPPWHSGYKKEINLAEARLKRNDFVQVRKELGITDKNISGHISRGPVSESFGQITFNRFIKIYDSIKAISYQPEKMNSGHIKGTFFVTQNDYRVLSAVENTE